MNYGYQVHGYRSGHQCLFNSVQLNRIDQDTIDRLSDISGPLKPSEIFTPYLTCYPLPSNTFFVLARTWQDLSAARAGCVITKSLLVPMNQWQSEENSAPLLTILIQASPDKSEPLNFNVNPQIYNQLLSSAIKTPVNELVEAIFIEKRQPIVFFNASDNDSIIYRLYSVLWSSLKGSFATCTFALSQRTIEGKPFDLLFAPISAKPRFNEWPGRRIDGQANPSRHRWTAGLMNSIYNGDRPHLLDEFDNLPFNHRAIDFTESHFRLNLAWQELLYNAKTSSPFLPILGLLDIVNSLKFDTSNLRETIHPILRSAIDEAAKNLSPVETWNFFASVLIRYKRKSMDRELFELIKLLCVSLAEKDPKSAVDFLVNYKKPIETLPSILFEGIGDGFAYCFKDQGEINPSVSRDKFDLIAIRLTASSSRFAKLLIEKTDFENIEWEAVLNAIFQGPQNKLKIQAEKNLSLHIHTNTRTSTIESLFGNSNAEGFELIAKNVLKVNHFELGIFTELIFYHTVRVTKQEFLFDFLLRYDKKGSSDELLSLVIFSDLNLLWRILRTNQIDNQRIGKILNYIFEISDDRTVNILRNNDVLAKEIVTGPFKNYLSEKSLMTLLFYSELPVQLIIRESARLSEKTFNAIPSKQLEYVVKKLVKQDNITLDQPTINILKKVSTFDYKILFQKATHRSLGVNILLVNLDSLFKINNRFNRFLSENANTVSRLLAETLDDKRIDNEIAQRWIRFLHESAKYKKPYKEAAVAMLEFGFKCVSFDSTQLIAASFPIVYKSFLKGKPITNFLPMFSFPDWDKCRTLREDLVKLYLNRSWSRVGLIYIASATDILKETLRILHDKKNGRNFLQEAIVELEKLPNRSVLLKQIFQETR